MPRSAASSSVPGLVTVTHSGGCGFCTGFGSTLRSGIEKRAALASANGSCGPHLRQHAHELVPGLLGVVGIRRRSRRARSTSTSARCRTRAGRPRGCRAWRRARRRGSGWFISGTHTTAPWPTRMRCVCIATAVRKTSGAEQCEYSSRKWCSTAHTAVEAELVGERAPARARSRRPALDAAAPNGRGTDSSKKIPNFTRRYRYASDESTPVIACRGTAASERVPREGERSELAAAPLAPAATTSSAASRSGPTCSRPGASSRRIFWEQRLVDPVLLELCRLRIAQLHGSSRAAGALPARARRGPRRGEDRGARERRRSARLQRARARLRRLRRAVRDRPARHHRRRRRARGRAARRRRHGRVRRGARALRRLRAFPPDPRRRAAGRRAMRVPAPRAAGPVY